MNPGPLLPDERPQPLRLALRPREAAQALGVSERTLWAWTASGDVPHLKRGATILYPVAALARWLEAQTSGSSSAPAGSPGDCAGGGEPR